MQQNLLVVIASYVFYGWWDWRFLLLIAFTSLCSYISGIAIARFRENRKIQKSISATNIIVNLLILCIFKYFNFFAESFADLFSTIGYQMDTVSLDIILPVGISFYTFQALSYTIDVYQKKIEPTKDIVQFFAYISFFPQLVAGPIERATNLLPQFYKKRKFDYPKAVDGVRQMLWGFVKKLIVADNCAFVVNRYWDSYTDLPGLSILILGVLFTIQIYCDFSGYSDIAIGCARLFGLNLKCNFNYPFFSRNIPEFWRRWHMSLMTWFRDYVYIPLGGSRCAKWKIVRNTLIVFFVSGLWHGANWTFVCWGLFHALLISVYIVFGINTKVDETISNGRILPSVTDAFRMAATFFLVVIGFMIFRAESMNQIIGIIQSIFNNSLYDSTHLYGLRYILLAFIMLTIEWMQRNKQHALQFPDKNIFNRKAVRWSLYLTLYVLIICFTGQSQTFIYFQF